VYKDEILGCNMSITLLEQVFMLNFIWFTTYLVLLILPWLICKIIEPTSNNETCPPLMGLMLESKVVVKKVKINNIQLKVNSPMKY
jgi:hypothetical protein